MKRKTIIVCMLMLFFCSCAAKTSVIEKQPTALPTITFAPTALPTITIAPTTLPTITLVPTTFPTEAQTPTLTPIPGTWVFTSAKNSAFDWTAETYDYACYIMEINLEDMKLVINPILYFSDNEQERWLAAGNTGELTAGYDLLDEKIDPLELSLTDTTEYHMWMLPADYSAQYIKENCDRYYEAEYVSCDAALFSYYLNHFTESATQFFEEGKNNLPWFVILDETGNVVYMIEGPRW